jgi:hypothetical protein
MGRTTDTITGLQTAQPAVPARNRIALSRDCFAENRKRKWCALEKKGAFHLLTLEEGWGQLA